MTQEQPSNGGNGKSSHDVPPEIFMDIGATPGVSAPQVNAVEEPQTQTKAEEVRSGKEQEQARREKSNAAKKQGTIDDKVELRKMDSELVDAKDNIGYEQHRSGIMNYLLRLYHFVTGKTPRKRVGDAVSVVERKTEFYEAGMKDITHEVRRNRAKLITLDSRMSEKKAQIQVYKDAIEENQRSVVDISSVRRRINALDETELDRAIADYAPKLAGYIEEKKITSVADKRGLLRNGLSNRELAINEEIGFFEDEVDNLRKSRRKDDAEYRQLVAVNKSHEARAKQIGRTILAYSEKTADEGVMYQAGMPDFSSIQETAVDDIEVIEQAGLQIETYKKYERERDKVLEDNLDRICSKKLSPGSDMDFYDSRTEETSRKDSEYAQSLEDIDARIDLEHP